MTTRFSDHLLEGTHASRPAATAVPEGTLYSCSDHDLVYQSDGATWSTWATVGVSAHATSHQNGGSDEIDVTGLTGAGGGAGSELDYAQVTSSVNITATAEASANTIVSGAAVSYAAVPTLFEFFCPNVDTQNTALASTTFYLYDGSSSIGIIGNVRQQTSAEFYTPVVCKRRLTPSAATHTYSVRATTTSGTGVATAGAGGSGNYVPIYLRITLA